jgi:iron complex outermembrane receptor protein
MPDMLVYATTRTGYRSGGFNPGATVNTTAAPTVSTPFRPETITDVEIGFKGNWRWDNGMSARFNVAGYHDAYNNIQRSLSTSTAGGQKLVTANAASATIKGVEVEAGFEPTNWLEISGYYSYIDAKFKKFVINDPVSFNAASQGDFSKSAFSGLPTHSGGASLTLHDDLADNRGRLSASLDYYGQTSIYMQDNNFLTTTQTFVAADRLPGYWLLGANISWSNVMGKSVDLAFNIRNILNKRYATGGSDALTAGLGSIVQFIGEPRMFTFNLTYNF